MERINGPKIDGIDVDTKLVASLLEFGKDDASEVVALTVHVFEGRRDEDTGSAPGSTAYGDSFTFLEREIREGDIERRERRKSKKKRTQ